MSLSKTNKIRLLTLAWVVAIVLTSVVTIWVEEELKSTALKETQWFQCTHVNMDMIRGRMGRSLTEHPEWIAEVSIPLLVRNGYLPEWSEVFICPADFQITFNRSRVFDDQFRLNLQSASMVAAYFTNTSYRIEVQNGVATVRCRWHTNVTDYSFTSTSMQHKW